MPDKISMAKVSFQKTEKVYIVLYESYEYYEVFGVFLSLGTSRVEATFATSSRVGFESSQNLLLRVESLKHSHLESSQENRFILYNSSDN
jgi:hypothetical protein